MRCWRGMFFERQRCVCRNSETQRQMSIPRISVRRGGCARRTRSQRFVLWSFARRGRFADDFFIPAGMVALGEGDGNVTANDRAKRAALREHAHVHVNQEKANGEQRRRGMNKNGNVAQEAKVPRNVLREPQYDAAGEQGHGAPEEPRRPKCQSGHQEINVRARGYPVRQSLLECVPEEVPVRKYLFRLIHGFPPLGLMSSSSRALGPNLR